MRHSINGGHRQDYKEIMLARLIGGDCCYSSLIFISGILRREDTKISVFLVRWPWLRLRGLVTSGSLCVNGPCQSSGGLFLPLGNDGGGPGRGNSKNGPGSPTAAFHSVGNFCGGLLADG